MKSVTFEITPDELDNSLIDSIKALFGRKKLIITVTEDVPSFGSVKNLSEIISENKKAKTVYQLSGETLEMLAEKLATDETFNILQAIEDQSVSRP